MGIVYIYKVIYANQVYIRLEIIILYMSLTSHPFFFFSSYVVTIKECDKFLGDRIGPKISFLFRIEKWTVKYNYIILRVIQNFL